MNYVKTEKQARLCSPNANGEGILWAGYAQNLDMEDAATKLNEMQLTRLVYTVGCGYYEVGVITSTWVGNLIYCIVGTMAGDGSLCLLC
jgi:hypothetical protein